VESDLPSTIDLVIAGQLWWLLALLPKTGVVIRRWVFGELEDGSTAIVKSLKFIEVFASHAQKVVLCYDIHDKGRVELHRGVCTLQKNSCLVAQLLQLAPQRWYIVEDVVVVDGNSQNFCLNVAQQSDVASRGSQLPVSLSGFIRGSHPTSHLS
jgi:hypothetical protein